MRQAEIELIYLEHVLKCLICRACRKVKSQDFKRGVKRANKIVFLVQEALPNSNNVNNIKYTCVLCSKLQEMLKKTQ